ncbi:MAG: ABC transporter ATP-binding protein [Pseudomonadota bacterium]
MTLPVIEVVNLSHDYGETGTGIRNISFCVQPGEFILVAGRNGSGKSTLFRHLNGLQHPTSGDVLVKGRSVITHPMDARKTVGMVFQDPDLQILGETVGDDTAFGPENLGLSRQEITERVNTSLSALGLLHLKDRSPVTLSGGEKRRLAIAGVLAMHPEVIVLDEPFSNLDYPGSLDLLDCVTSLHASGCTIILATHDIEKVIACATRMIVLDKGTLAADGPPRSLVKTVEVFGVREPCASRFGMEILPWKR